MFGMLPSNGCTKYLAGTCTGRALAAAPALNRSECPEAVLPSGAATGGTFTLAAIAACAASCAARYAACATGSTGAGGSADPLTPVLPQEPPLFAPFPLTGFGAIFH